VEKGYCYSRNPEKALAHVPRSKTWLWAGTSRKLLEFTAPDGFFPAAFNERAKRIAFGSKVRSSQNQLQPETLQWADLELHKPVTVEEARVSVLAPQ
jgi:hypothetical protein